MRHLAVVGFALLVLVGSLGCQPPGSASKADVDAISAKQDEILAKLTALEAGQKRLAAAPAKRPGPPPEDFNKVHKINTAGSPVLGNPDAPIELVEYSDFQCPFCDRVRPVLKEVLEKNQGKVKLVFKHFPLSFHRSARPAAVASMAAAEQGKFWEMHDVLFENHRSLDSSKFEEYAQKAGLDVERFKADLAKNKAAYEKKVSSDFSEGQSNDVRGTPSLYIGGKKVRARSPEAMSAMIEEALKASGG
ncbi:MAG: thioredoxin domain-containing protein [bacterium]|nr:thioredoxin domain-containing protein [bacterium]